MDENLFYEFAYVIPLQGFIYKTGGAWNFDKPVKKEGIVHYLLERGMGQGDILTMLKDKAYLKVFGAEMLPNEPAMYRDRDGNAFINLWVPPTLKPAPGDYPTIEMLLRWLCGNDEAGVEWMVHWLALKVQQPDIVPKVAAVFSTKQGAGKGTLFRIIEEMLGAPNVVQISRNSLESRFNAMWAQKLFVLADEVMTNENVKDVSDRLKQLIDSKNIELEGKGRDQVSSKNRLAWLFASNDTTSPVTVERGDRRYSVFFNHDPLPDDYRQAISNCYEADRLTMTQAFLGELQGFYYDLLNLDVDRGLVSMPYVNEAREQLIEASLPSHEMFFRDVDENGIDPYLEQPWQLSTRPRPEWDFGENGIATEVLYKAYAEYCKQTGQRAFKMNRFGMAAKHHRPAWEWKRNTSPTGRRVPCYVVKRSGAVKEAA